MKRKLKWLPFALLSPIAILTPLATMSMAPTSQEQPRNLEQENNELLSKIRDNLVLQFDSLSKDIKSHWFVNASGPYGENEQWFDVLEDSNYTFKAFDKYNDLTDMGAKRDIERITQIKLPIVNHLHSYYALFNKYINQYLEDITTAKNELKNIETSNLNKEKIDEFQTKYQTLTNNSLHSLVSNLSKTFQFFSTLAIYIYSIDSSLITEYGKVIEEALATGPTEHNNYKDDNNISNNINNPVEQAFVQIKDFLIDVGYSNRTKNSQFLQNIQRLFIDWSSFIRNYITFNTTDIEYSSFSFFSQSTNKRVSLFVKSDQQDELLSLSNWHKALDSFKTLYDSFKTELQSFVDKISVYTFGSTKQITLDDFISYQKQFETYEKWIHLFSKQNPISTLSSDVFHNIEFLYETNPEWLKIYINEIEKDFEKINTKSFEPFNKDDYRELSPNRELLSQMTYKLINHHNFALFLKSHNFLTSSNSNHAESNLVSVETQTEPQDEDNQKDAKIQELENKISELQAKLDSKSNSIMALSSQVSIQASKIKELQSQKDDLQRQINILTSLKSQLENQKDTLTTNIQSLNQDLEAKNQKIDQLEKQNSQKDTNITSLNNQLLEKDKTISNLSDNNTKLQEIKNSLDLLLAKTLQELKRSQDLKLQEFANNLQDLKDKSTNVENISTDKQIQQIFDTLNEVLKDYLQTPLNKDNYSQELLKAFDKFSLQLKDAKHTNQNLIIIIIILSILIFLLLILLILLALKSKKQSKK